MLENTGEGDLGWKGTFKRHLDAVDCPPATQSGELLASSAVSLCDTQPQDESVFNYKDTVHVVPDP